MIYNDTKIDVLYHNIYENIYIIYNIYVTLYRLDARYGPKSDVFSLGCSAFEARELRRAFSAMAAEARP